MKKALRITSIFIFSSVAIYFGIAFALILSQGTSDLSKIDTISFASVTSQGMKHSLPLKSVPSDNGSAIRYRHIPANSPAAPLIIVIHGSGWHGEAYLNLANSLAQDGKFEVLVPDLRGHGPNPDRRGDVDYIGQLEDDLATLINAHGGSTRSVAMVGHSSGGGLIIRFAGGKHRALLNRAVLVAPFLHHSAPTIRENAGGWAHPLINRIIGLSMLNSVGVTAFNDTTIMQFNYPDSVLKSPKGHTATTAYSYRLNTSFAPRDDYKSDVSKLPEFLLIAGAEDEAFHADQFQPTMRAASNKGTYLLLPNVDHIGIIGNQAAQDQISKYLSTPF
jgi:alpha-beta hydrolase superfamily lysophospholipase